MFLHTSSSYTPLDGTIGWYSEVDKCSQVLIDTALNGETNDNSNLNWTHSLILLQSQMGQKVTTGSCRGYERYIRYV